MICVRIIRECPHNVLLKKRQGVDRVLQWAKKVVRDLDYTVRRIFRLYDIHWYDHDEVRIARRVNKSKKKRHFSREPIYTYVLMDTEHFKDTSFEECDINWHDYRQCEIGAICVDGYRALQGYEL